MLVRRLRLGDPDAISDLYERHGPATYRLLLRMLRDRAAAEDVQQQVYFEVWRRAKQYDPKQAGLASWIAMIARSRAIDYMRKRVPEPMSAEAVSRLPSDGGQESATDLLLDRWCAVELLATLPDDERELLRLRFYDKRSQTEIAQRLGLPLATVRAQMARALRGLSIELDSSRDSA